MDFLGSTDWLGVAMKLNQASLLPFLAFLYFLSRIPEAPRLSVRGFYMYLVFVAVGIPASIYCKTVLGTSMANVDYIHGPTEMLLTLANLFIVLGLRDAIQAHTADATTATSTDSTIPATASQPAAAASAATAKGSSKHHLASNSHDALDDMHYMQSLHHMYSTKQTTGSTSSTTMDFASPSELSQKPSVNVTGRESYPARPSVLPLHIRPMPSIDGTASPRQYRQLHHYQPFMLYSTAERIRPEAVPLGRNGHRYFTPARMPARSLLRVHGSPAAPVTAPARLLQ